MAHTIPYSDLDELNEERQAQYIADGEPFEFGHTLEDQIGGQIEAGLVSRGFGDDDNSALARAIREWSGM